MNENDRLLMKTVVENDYCIGCGICASLTGSPWKMKWMKTGNTSRT